MSDSCGEVCLTGCAHDPCVAGKQLAEPARRRVRVTVKDYNGAPVGKPMDFPYDPAFTFLALRPPVQLDRGPVFLEFAFEFTTDEPLDEPAVDEQLVDEHQPPGREPVMAGTYAVYEDGRGGFVLVADDAAHGVQRRHVPVAIVKLFTAAAGGTGGGVMGKMLGRMLGGG